MPDPVDSRWPKILSLTVHELRTPMTVVGGYIRMLLKDRAGPVTDDQRRLLEEAEKSCAKLSGLVSEISELSHLEAGTLTFNRRAIDARAALRRAADQVPPAADHDVAIVIEVADGAAMVQGDPQRLGQAFIALFVALRRELLTSDRLIVREHHGASSDAARTLELRIGDEETLAAFDNPSERPVFDEWRGGVGLSLAVARRILDAHGGRLQGVPDGRKAGAVVTLPLL